MDEIVVTGERVHRSLRQTDSSVEVFDAKRLNREPGAHRLDDLYEATPNVVVGNPGLGPTIRGQDTTGPLVDFAAFLGGTRPRMTLNIDGRAASYNELVFGSAPLWDVAQVEVFRSPQSTIEGRNSIAGATYVRTNSPTPDWQGAGRLLFDLRGTSQISAMVNGPLVGDILAFRLSADLRRAEPWSQLADTQDGADPDHDDYGLVRAKILVTPDGLPGSRFELGMQHLRSKAPQTVTTVRPFERRRDPAPLYGIFANRISTATLRAEIPVSNAIETQSILSFGRSRFRRYAPPGRGEAINLVRDSSLEGRVSWRPAERIRINGGIHALETELDQEIDLTAIVGTGSFDDQQTAVGVFGEIEAGLLPTLTATASLRRQSDRQRRSGAITGALTLPVEFDRTFTFWLPRFSLRWDASDQLTLGATIQRASNPGGASLNFETGEHELLEAETLWNFELFARATFSEPGLSVQANLFRNEHRDSQRAIARVFTGPSGNLTWYELYNLERARSEGLEATVNWRASAEFTLRAGVGLLRTNIIEGAGGLAFEGKSFARAPKRSLTIGFDWAPVDNLEFTGRLRHHSSYYSDDLNSAVRKVEAGTEADVRASYKRGFITFYGYARNITDEFAATYLLSQNIAVPNRPREIGLGIETTF